MQDDSQQTPTTPPPVNHLDTPPAPQTIAGQAANAGYDSLTIHEYPSRGIGEQAAAGATTEKRSGSWVTSRSFTITLALLITFIIGPYVLYVLNMRQDLTDQVLSNGEHTYEFKFYESAVRGKVGHLPALVYKHDAAAMVELPNDQSVSSDQLMSGCTDIDSDAAQAFTANIGGTERPVCTIDKNGERIYVTDFSAAGTVHAFAVTYYTDSGNARKLSSDTKSVQSIFSSIKVLK